jgi:CubicO group peptidase (beta-lactamase class C family)
VTRVEGHVAPGYEPVRSAFAANFADHGEVGAACCVHVDGEVVVDLWGGTTEPSGPQPYTADTLQLVFSATKAAVAVCVHLLAERGALDLDRPVAASWPEFAAAGKEDVTVRQVLSHTAGVPAIDADLTLADALAWEPVVGALAAQAPAWVAGTQHGYHALTFGWLLGEVVRRVSGRSVGRFFAEEVAGPLGLDFWIGLPADQQARVAPLIPFEEPADPDVLALTRAFLDPSTLTGRTLQGPGSVFGDVTVFNRRDVRAAEIPSNNGVTNARSLSRFYAALVGELDGVRLLRPETVAQAAAVAAQGSDAILLLETAYGLGFQLPSFSFPDGGPGSFGHLGAGGALGYAHPERRVGFGYVMNAMQQHLGGDPRNRGLVAAVRRCTER